MKPAYGFALAAAAGTLGAVLVGIVVGPDQYPALLLIAAAGGPLAILAAVTGRLERPVAPVALVAGPFVGIGLVVVGSGVVAMLTYGLIAGMATAAGDLVDTLLGDPRLVDVLESPWVIAAIVSAAVVAPLVEEAGKALGGRLSMPAGRREAFLAGVAAGVGFAVVENIAYAGLGTWFGGAWPEIALERSLGVAVHPLATGLVMLGWWDARHEGRRYRLLQGYLAGVGVHALWNGSLVAISVAEATYDFGNIANSATTAGFGYLIALAVALAAGLWHTTRVVANDGDPVAVGEVADGRSLAAWTLITASILVPVALLVAAFPGFYLG